MTIETEVVNRTTAVLRLSGRLDTSNAPLLEQRIKQWGSEITSIVLDFDEVDYISSMGLRVLLAAQKSSAEKRRAFTIKHMQDSVRKVFEMTGLVDLVVREEGFAVLRKDEEDGIVLHLNGELNMENVKDVAGELAKIRKTMGKKKGVTVTLDMEKLYCIMPSALMHLREAIDDTSWDGRKLFVRNVPLDYRKEISEGQHL